MAELWSLRSGVEPQSSDVMGTPQQGAWEWERLVPVIEAEAGWGNVNVPAMSAEDGVAWREYLLQNLRIYSDAESRDILEQAALWEQGLPGPLDGGRDDAVPTLDLETIYLGSGTPLKELLRIADGEFHWGIPVPDHRHRFVADVEPLISQYSEWWVLKDPPSDTHPVHVSKVFCAFPGCTARPDTGVSDGG